MLSLQVSSDIDVTIDQEHLVFCAMCNQWLNVWSVYFHFDTLSCQNQGERQYSKAKGWTDFFSYVEFFRSEDLSICFF